MNLGGNQGINSKVTPASSCQRLQGEIETNGIRLGNKVTLLSSERLWQIYEGWECQRKYLIYQALRNVQIGPFVPCQISHLVAHLPGVLKAYLLHCFVVLTIDQPTMDATTR
ncbi:uncharacterized [Tachysurus ichikawai]